MRTDSWRHGDPATFTGLRGDVTGSVIVFHRRVDRARFVKVRIVSGSEAGVEVWADGWIIGTGPHEHACLDCGYRYRSTDPRAGFCPPCDGDLGAPVRVPDEAAPSGVASVRPNGRPWGRVGRR
jgi:hypothetical protein